jgi:excisionase family DNA binding protein
VPELLTRAEIIEYLRLDTDDRNAAERLRNLIRRQGLPFLKRGRLFLFRKSAVDAWLNGNYPVSGRAARPAKHSQEKAA